MCAAISDEFYTSGWLPDDARTGGGRGSLDLVAGGDSPAAAENLAGRQRALRAKRAFDAVGSLLLLLLTTPLLLLVAVVIKVSSPGPVLFRQQRVGRGGVPFTMYKFRSMRADAEAVLAADAQLYSQYLANNYKLEPADDPRITGVGRVIRKLSIDELPQFWNVLRGQMALVGPRPILVSELARYGDRADAYLGVRPGLTGAWQVAGRSTVAFVDRVRLDIDYFDQWSVAKEMKILARTPLAVLGRRGAC